MADGLLPPAAGDAAPLGAEPALPLPGADELTPLALPVGVAAGAPVPTLFVGCDVVLGPACPEPTPAPLGPLFPVPTLLADGVALGGPVCPELGPLFPVPTLV